MIIKKWNEVKVEEIISSPYEIEIDGDNKTVKVKAGAKAPHDEEVLKIE